MAGSKQTTRVIWVGLGVLVLMSCALGYALVNGGPAKNETGLVVPSTYSTPGAGKVGNPPASPASSQTIAPGVWYVGPEGVLPGTYRVSQVLPQDSMCYWSISSDEAGQDIVANDIVTAGTPQVKLKKGQWFKSDGCGNWRKR